MVIVKNDINKMLIFILGDDQLVIDMWWTTPNVAMAGKSPESVYQSGDEGRKYVYNYVYSHYEIEGGS